MTYLDALFELKNLGCIVITTNGEDLALIDAIQSAYEIPEDMDDQGQYCVDGLNVWKIKKDGFRESVPSCTGLK